MSKPLPVTVHLGSGCCPGGCFVCLLSHDLGLTANTLPIFCVGVCRHAYEGLEPHIYFVQITQRRPSARNDTASTSCPQAVLKSHAGSKIPANASSFQGREAFESWRQIPGLVKIKHRENGICDQPSPCDVVTRGSGSQPSSRKSELGGPRQNFPLGTDQARDLVPEHAMP